MRKQLPNFVTIKSQLAAMAGVALLTALFAESQAQAAPLAGALRQLKPHQTEGALVRVGAKVIRERRALDRYGYHHLRFRNAGEFAGYGYTDLDDSYEGDEYYPPQPHYFSHRYNWYPPLATFRYADGPWYAW
jgi:hypothetical protein